MQRHQHEHKVNSNKSFLANQNNMTSIFSQGIIILRIRACETGTVVKALWKSIFACLGLQSGSAFDWNIPLMRTLEGSRWRFKQLSLCHSHRRHGSWLLQTSVELTNSWKNSVSSNFSLSLLLILAERPRGNCFPPLSLPTF